MTSSPYFFASIADEYARRGEHVEITRPNGERVLVCGTVPPPDVSTCAAEVEPEREVPVEYAPGWWMPMVGMVLLSVLASAVWIRFH